MPVLLIAVEFYLCILGWQVFIQGLDLAFPGCPRIRTAVARINRFQEIGRVHRLSTDQRWVSRASKTTSEFFSTLNFTVINAENAAHKSDKFVALATRTRQEYLKDLANNYVSSHGMESGFGKIGALTDEAERLGSL